MCNQNVQQKIKDSFVKQEERQEKEDEDEEIVVEEEEEEKDTQEPHVPAESSLRKRNQLHLNAPQKRRNQGRRRQTFKMMKQLLK